MSSLKYLMDSTWSNSTASKLYTVVYIREVCRVKMQIWNGHYSQVSHADWGVYTCEAHNTMGQGRATVMLKSEHQIMIYGRRKHKKCSEDLRNNSNSSTSTSGNRNIMKDSTSVSKIPYIFFLHIMLLTRSN